jgi:hypothetical protein
MSKTKPEIAKAILERRNRMTHVIMPGEINAEIGPEGVQEALNERWLVPDMESGFLCATNDLGKIEEMRKLASMKPEEYAPEPIPVRESHDASLTHTLRRNVIQEIAAPGTGGQSPGLTAVAQPQSAPMMQPATPAATPQPSAPAAPAAPAQGGFAVGTPVTVSRGGASASGMIEKLMPDGRYKLGFGADQKPIPGDGVFSKEEMSAMAGGAGRPAVDS